MECESRHRDLPRTLSQCPVGLSLVQNRARALTIWIAAFYDD